MKDLSKYKHIVYDLDGTLVKLNINWDGWHTGIRKIIKSFKPDFAETGHMVKFHNPFVKEYGSEIRKLMLDFNRDYESKGIKSYTVNKELVDFIKNNPQINHYILSSNSTEPIHKVLNELGIFDKFTLIITRDDVRCIKPDPEGMLRIINNRDRESFIYLGDAPTDEEVAKVTNVAFKYVKF